MRTSPILTGMSRKKLVAEPVAQQEAPAEQESELSALVALVPEHKPTKRVTRQNLESVQRGVLLKHTEPMLHEAFEVLRIKLRAGDKDALRLALELNKLIGVKGQVSVTTNVQQNNHNEAKVTAEHKGFDDLVRRLDGRQHQITTNADFVDVSA